LSAPHLAFGFNTNERFNAPPGLDAMCRHDEKGHALFPHRKGGKRVLLAAWRPRIRIALQSQFVGLKERT
jgi:hypothetical protein